MEPRIGASGSFSCPDELDEALADDAVRVTTPFPVTFTVACDAEHQYPVETDIGMWPMLLEKAKKYIKLDQLGEYEDGEVVAKFYLRMDENTDEFDVIRIELTHIGATHQRLRSHLSPRVAILDMNVA